MTEPAAIEGIEQGKWAFYVPRGGRTSDVLVETRNGRRYLKTTNDGARPDNLLSLESCPL